MVTNARNETMTNLENTSIDHARDDTFYWMEGDVLVQAATEQYPDDPDLPDDVLHGPRVAVWATWFSRQTNSETRETRYFEPVITVDASMAREHGKCVRRDFASLSLFDLRLLQPDGEDDPWRGGERRRYVHEYDAAEALRGALSDGEAWSGLSSEIMVAAGFASGWRERYNAKLAWWRSLERGAFEREEYEAYAEEHGLKGLSDDEIRQSSYAFQYFRADVHRYSYRLLHRTAAAKARWKGIEAVEKPKRDAARRKAIEEERDRLEARPRCHYAGCSNAATMNASLGQSCPEHYDDLSGICVSEMCLGDISTPLYEKAPVAGGATGAYHCGTGPARSD